MKAILINNQIQYFQNFSTFKNIINIQQASEQQIYDLGFRDVIIPIISSTQSLGEIYFDNTNDVWTYYIIEKTQEELDEDLYQLEFQDEFADLENKHEEDGKQLYRRIKFKIRKLLANGTITLTQFNTVRRFLRPAILPLNTGDWDIAKENVDALIIPTNTKLLAILNTVKDLINDYIIKNNIV